MRRFHCTLYLLLIARVVFAAPAPKDTWERHIDPDNDCKFVFKGGTVTVVLPGTYHDISLKRKRFNAPRLLREIEGDFVFQIRVCAAFSPSSKSSVDGMDPGVSAGLVLIPFEKNYVIHEYGAYRRKGGRENCFTSQILGEQLGVKMERTWNPDYEVPRVKPPIQGQDKLANMEYIYMRIERQGNWIRTSISPDAKTWAPRFSTTGAELPGKLKVGLIARSTSTEAFKVHFDQFELIRGKKQEKGDVEPAPRLRRQDKQEKN